MKNSWLKNYILMVIGGMIVGFGVAFVVYSNLGGDTMTTFQQWISVFFKIQKKNALLFQRQTLLCIDQ